VSIPWTTAARGGRVIPCVLIAGLPVVLIPEGVTLTGWTAGGLDGAWWPGSSFAGFSTYIKAWLSLAAPLTWEEKAEPVQPEMLNISSLTVNVSDIGLRADGTGGLATALFAARDSIDGTWITADVPTSVTDVDVASTSGFASSGDIYVGRETMTYTSKTSTRFVVGSAANRGKYGSPVQHHWYTGNANAALSNPEVTSGAPEIIGRTATVWLLNVNPAGVVTDGELAFYGAIGGGVVLSDDGEVWSLRIDHAVKKLSAPLRGETVTIGGYVHLAPRGDRGAFSAGRTPQLGVCPTYDVWQDASDNIVAINTLTVDLAAPDNGGWHPTAQSYVEALNAACQPLTPKATYTLVGDKLQVTAISYGTNRLMRTWPWDGVEGRATFLPFTSTAAFPKAWVPIADGSRVYLSATDYAVVPDVPTSAVTGVVDVFYVLVVGEGDDARYARIDAKTSSGGVYYLTCSAIAGPARVPSVVAFRVTEPTSARLGCYVRATSWVSALQALVESFDTTLADNTSDAFDFDDMRTVAAQYVGPFAGQREYLVDLSQSISEIVTNECRLNGFALVIRNGRISIARVTDFAPTETLAGSITTADLDANSPRPSYARGFDGIVNAVRFNAPQAGVTVNVVDATSLSRYGAGRTTVEATAPLQLGGRILDPSAVYVALAGQASMILGPHRFPYEQVTFTTTVAKAGFDVGDAVSLSLWRVPDQQSARGISSRVAQITSRAPTFYAGAATVTYTARLSPQNLAGWAPSALVDAGGISGAVVTLDTTTFGASGFAPTGSDGGAAYFAAGDAVRLVEINATSPTASTQHTVTLVSGAALTLSPPPSATFGTLAASALKVMVIPDDWGTATATQEEYAYLSGTTYRLDSTTRARIYAP